METAKEAALKVIVLDPKISSWLKENDPKALEQAQDALSDGKGYESWRKAEGKQSIYDVKITNPEIWATIRALSRAIDNEDAVEGDRLHIRFIHDRLAKIALERAAKELEINN